MIDQITIDRIIEAARIEDVVGEFVTLKKKGVNLIGLCPFHTDKTPSFYVSPSKNICKCFACGEGGNSVHFIMKHEQLNYYEALKYLAKKYNIEVTEKELTDEQKNAYNERESLFILNDFAKNYFVNVLNNHQEGKIIGLGYFKERGFREDIIKKFQLGYSLEDREAFTKDALKNGFKKEYLLKTGLTIEGENYTVDRFRGRVMFPVHTLSGKVVAFGGRILKKAENTGKYVNSPESDIYHKSNHLYGLFFSKQAITKADKCFLVEGYTDVISMHQAGIENVVASSGTALTENQIRLIHRFTSNITVLYDGDSAGIKAALRGIDMLLEDGMNVKVVLLPEGEDPDSFSRKQNAEKLKQYLQNKEVDFIRFKTQLLISEAGNDPIKRANLITDIVNSIGIIPDSIIRSVYIKDCSALLGVDERILMNEVNRKRINAIEKESLKKTQTNNLSADSTLISSHSDREVFEPIGFQSSNKDNAGLDKYELAILYYIIRFGHLPIQQSQNEEDENVEVDKTTVLEYIKFDLERDGLHIQNPLYKTIYEEAVAQMNNSNFIPSRYFLSHPKQEISLLTAHLLEDRYELSKIHTRQYGENVKADDTPLAEAKQLEYSVPRVLTELKDAFISLQISSIEKQMITKQSEGDIDTCIKLMAQRKELVDIKNVLSKILGERVVLKW